MSEILRLKHGTSQELIGEGVLRGESSLIGRNVLNSPLWSGSLTNNMDTAVQWAHRRGLNPVVLIYDIPLNKVVNYGRFSEGANGYGTTDTIEFENLPVQYLTTLATVLSIKPSILQAAWEANQISFHEVLGKYLQDVKEV